MIISSRDLIIINKCGWNCYPPNCLGDFVILKITLTIVSSLPHVQQKNNFAIVHQLKYIVWRVRRTINNKQLTCRDSHTWTMCNWLVWCTIIDSIAYLSSYSNGLNSHHWITVSILFYPSLISFPPILFLGLLWEGPVVGGLQIMTTAPGSMSNIFTKPI